MVVNKTKKIKVINNMPVGALGLDLPDGKTYVLRQPGASRACTSEEIWHIFNSCKTIQKGHAYIDDKDMRIELGLEEDDSVDVNALSKEDLRVIVDESDIVELKEVLESDLSNGTKERIVVLARDLYKEKGMDAKKLKLIEKSTGLPISENDGSEIEEINDVKEQKKIRKPSKVKPKE